MNKTKKFSFASIFRNQIFIPIVALLILVLFNLIADPSFFKITYQVNANGNYILNGNLIQILDFGSELAILAIGMTLVTAASGGQDISVGAAIAIAGSVVLKVLCGTNTRPEVGQLRTTFFVAFLVAVLAAAAFGAFNGVLVSVFKIQPMVATLILLQQDVPLQHGLTIMNFQSLVIQSLCILVDTFQVFRFQLQH